MSEYSAAVGGWLAELRRGRPTTWSRWLAAHPESSAADGPPRTSAVQLELIRRLAEDPPVRFEALADLVAATPPYGRGRGEVPLPWPAAPRFGPPPVEPEELPAPELLRVAGPVLARLAERLPEPVSDAQRPTTRWWRRGVTVSGPPCQAESLRRQLRAAGLREGGRNAARVVLVEPFEQAMFDLWASRVGEGSAVRWRRFWLVRARVDRVPAALDGPRLLRAEAPGRGRVHVVVTTDRAAASEALSGLLGVTVRLPASADWAATDLRRVLNRVLETRTSPQVRRSVADRVIGSPGATGAAPESAVPAPSPFRLWAHATATRLAADLEEVVTSGGYPVHGNIADLVGAGDHDRLEAHVPVTSSAEETLAAAVRAIRKAWVGVGGRH